MLIRFFKENDLVGCGGDPQPMRLQMRVGVHVWVHVGVRVGVQTIYELKKACVILTLFNILRNTQTSGKL